MSNETPHEPATWAQAPIETPDETPEETSAEMPVAASDETDTGMPGETADETTVETPAETPEETSAETQAETPVATSDETDTGMPGETADETTVETPVETPAETPEETSAEPQAETPVAASDEAPEETSAETPLADSDERSEETSAETSVETPEDTPEETSAETPVDDSDETPDEAPPAVPSTPVPPRPAPPRPAAPSPAALAAKLATARPAVPGPPDPSASARFGRVAEDGTVFVATGDEERAVGSYPGAGADDALQYFARKYDEVFGMAELLEQRLAGPSELSAREAAEQLAHLSDQMAEPAFVGDLAALQAKLDDIGRTIETRREEEAAHRVAAKATAASEREALVARAEAIAGQDVRKIQWKRSGEELRAIFEEWKAHQRASVKLDKPLEADLWHRFSAARTAFDKARRSHFAELEITQSEVKSAKEGLVKEAEKLATSRDWGPTAREFKRLMDRWRAAGRAGRSDDDALWERFKAAQDTFFTAKDKIAAAEDAEFRANLAVKDQLIVEADALLPITDLEAAKAALRSIQERWDKAGKVPRGDMERTEKALRRVEQAVRDLEDKKWSSSNPEARARAQSLVEQLETAVAGLEKDLASAQAKGNEKKVAEARAALEARQGWLDQARAGLDEFS